MQQRKKSAQRNAELEPGNAQRLSLTLHAVHATLLRLHHTRKKNALASLHPLLFLFFHV